jgi:hypothetical protein
VIDRLQAVLDEMDSWLASAASEETTPLPRDELIQWQITLTTLHEEMVKLQDASQSAVDAFLLRPSQFEPAAGSRRPTGQKLYQRLAEAMAELEQVLVELKASAD